MERDNRFSTLDLLMIAVLGGSSVVLRLYIDFANDLIPKVNGPYYLVQTRVFWETSHIAFNDTPFIFYLYGLVSKAHAAAANIPGTEAILSTVKVLDSLIVPVSVIPFAILLSHILANSSYRTAKIAVVSAFVLFFFPSFLLFSDFQKNELGLLLFSFLLLALYRLESTRKKIHALCALILLLLIAVVHVGVFAISILLIGFYAMAAIRLTKRLWLALGASIALLATCSLLLEYVFGVQKLFAFLSDPIKLFKQPEIISYFSHASNAMQSIDFFASTSIFLCSLAWIAFSRRSGRSYAAIVVSCAALTACLTCPLIGADYADRLFYMSFFPFSLVIADTLSRLKGFYASTAMCSLIAAILLVFSPPAISAAFTPTIAPQSASELVSLKALLDSDSNSDLIIARHGLEWWSAWFLHADVSQEYDISQAAWDEYKHVYVLVEKTPGSKFPEAQVPSDAAKVFDGNYYTLYLARNYPGFYPLKREQ